MKVTEKQVQIMFRALEGSLSIADRSDMNIFGFNKATRLAIFEEIINQQSDKVIDIKDESEKP